MPAPLRRPCLARPLLDLSPLSLALVAALPGLANAQAMPAAAPPAAASAPATAPTPVTLQPVEVRATRNADTEERRQSTAAKIVVGRDEIERFGDATVGDLLKRLPGVTIGGQPGRGGAIRMRGLGNGYTQILIDGDRVPPGFSIESLAPEQVERIEILRAPTAETGARAIAGTINIVLREGTRQRLNQLRVGLGIETGRPQPGATWTRNDRIGDSLSYNSTLTVYRTERGSESTRDTTLFVPASGAVLRQDHETFNGLDRRNGLHANGRLQWRGQPGESAVLTPIVVLSDNRGEQRSTFTRSAGPAADYATSATQTDGGFGLLRLNGQYNRSLADSARLEWRAGLGRAGWDNRAQRVEYDSAGAVAERRDDREETRDNSANVGAKYTKLLADSHLLVAGFEGEAGRRTETQDRSADGRFEGRARSTRIAGYVQDEWTLSPQWALHGGLRWESIDTRADDVSLGSFTNRSRVASPLLHALYKLDPKSRDQIRMSLTRSYRAPALQNLITQPRLSGDAGSSPTNPERLGNPALRPELATGLDVAIERYLPGSGVLSANVFHRRITDYMRRTDATLDPVSGRYVSRMENVGKATTQGIELEAKFRASDVWAEAPRLDLRMNASAFRSKVDQVPGPDNRLDQQPGYTLNLGADYRVPGTPLTLGGNLGYTPAYTTRATEQTFVLTGKRRVGDVYALWSFNPDLQLRVSASNLAPHDYESGSRVDIPGVTPAADTRETSQTTSRGYTNVLLRLEMRL
jgi:iron complex outermembrane receptor protein